VQYCFGTMELELRASVYAEKAGTSRHPIDAIRDVYKDNVPIPNHIARNAVKRLDCINHTADKERKLSKRECEVLALISEGFQYKEIGESLKIEPETVRSHVKNICRKMGVRRRVEAIAKHLKDVS
jgi:DNA-binding NarL/FixJ family response regulator